MSENAGIGEAIELNVRIDAVLEKYDNATGKLVETIYIEDGEIARIIKEEE
jgi:hypothetical protein